MEQQKVSVIIPVYKTEKFIHSCVKSVLRQDYGNMEIILVDDGSPDGCPAVCDEYARSCPAIRVIHQENRGLWAARNTGLEAAKGVYLLFVDSDDRLDGDSAVSSLVSQAEKKRADIVVGSFRRFDGKTVSGVNHHHLRDGNYIKTVDFRFKGFYMYGHLAYNWGKLYRTDFLRQNGLWLEEYPFTQDKAHNMACYAHDPVYAFIDESVYLYRVNEESATFRYKENLMPVWISIAENFKNGLKKWGKTGKYGDLPAFHIFFGIFFLAEQEQKFKKNKIRESAAALKKYGENSFVRKSVRLLARGKYIGRIESRAWKPVIRTVSVLFDAHAYFLIGLGIFLLRRLRMDKLITKRRYKFGSKLPNFELMRAKARREV